VWHGGNGLRNRRLLENFSVPRVKKAARMRAIRLQGRGGRER
jgi:hypothetical protein